MRPPWVRPGRCHLCPQTQSCWGGPPPDTTHRGILSLTSVEQTWVKERVKRTEWGGSRMGVSGVTLRGTGLRDPQSSRGAAPMAGTLHPSVVVDPVLGGCDPK